MNWVNFIHLKTPYKTYVDTISSMKSWTSNTYENSIIDWNPLRIWIIAFNTKIIHILFHFFLPITITILTFYPHLCFSSRHYDFIIRLLCIKWYILKWIVRIFNCVIVKYIILWFNIISISHWTRFFFFLLFAKIKFIRFI